MTGATSTKAVKTGDNTPIGIFVILLIAAIVVIGGGIYLKRRKK
ncbi:LPXTG cell wall anchor domain-containing protein [Blautia sp. 2744]|uniref:LPXTG cell wall anchor domain-containing protein n=2 Tax=Blautia TaxID=572511 RepID=A0A414J5L0_9FIRM|nr:MULTISPECIES: LPXTG cell wall anchor domain-containing protein [Blautia]MBC5740769.1 LPXTG cell wall anchor domain-containing protein [Blautia intestinalis]RHA47648.1 LPXTG cell wall anchor domain-containing protein [Blautia obeum]RHD29679.1 LPXTG cell wall anchor domain-containing protein [Blautia obeum]RHE39668.1 LPXTG cell wall anchor domain-containing protein [Blautia obeum]